MLADQLREAIENSGRSINSIALAAGVPQPVLQRFMSGERDIRLETADKIADYFEMRLTKPKG
jgi:plasmid maintenance system antidote protein VapI